MHLQKQQQQQQQHTISFSPPLPCCFLAPLTRFHCAQCCTSGIPKLAVLPDPVCAHASRSRPASATGTAAAWMGVGAVKSRSAMACCRARSRFMSANDSMGGMAKALPALPLLLSTTVILSRCRMSSTCSAVSASTRADGAHGVGRGPPGAAESMDHERRIVDEGVGFGADADADGGGEEEEEEEGGEEDAAADALLRKCGGTYGIPSLSYTTSAPLGPDSTTMTAAAASADQPMMSSSRSAPTAAAFCVRAAAKHARSQSAFSLSLSLPRSLALPPDQQPTRLDGSSKALIALRSTQSQAKQCKWGKGGKGVLLLSSPLLSSPPRRGC